MANRVFPDEQVEWFPGEERDFQFDLVDELDGDTIGPGTVEVFDADGADVTGQVAPSTTTDVATVTTQWVVSGTTFTATFTIPKKRPSSSYLAIFSVQSSTSGEIFKKFLGIIIPEVSSLV